MLRHSGGKKSTEDRRPKKLVYREPPSRQEQSGGRGSGDEACVSNEGRVGDEAGEGGGGLKVRGRVWEWGVARVEE